MRSLCLLAALAVLVATPALAVGPIIDYQCAKKCVDNEGWNPVCASMGIIFPNVCALKTCVGWQDVAWYDYLPLRCGSSVACSLMGQDLEACKQTWTKVFDPSYVASSPKVDPMCECDGDLATETAGATPGQAAEPAANATEIDMACVEACMESDGWKPVCVDNDRSTEEYQEWSLFPNRCAFFNCTGASADTAAYDYLPLRCKGSSTCNQMARVVESCRSSWAGESGEDPATDAMCGCSKQAPEDVSMNAAARRLLKA